MSVRHTPAPPILTITSWGPSTFGSSISSTVGRSLYLWSRSACIDAPPRPGLFGGPALTVRSFDTSWKRTRSQTFTMVGKSPALPVRAGAGCRIAAARECWPGHDTTGAAATGRDRRRAAAPPRLPPAVAGQLPWLHRLPADRGGRARAGVRADRLLVLGRHAG